ncbi:MAG: hypothetical protein JWM48_1436 [Mycobacterium sp.]|nr:hypothetical protein [Mycobacterium sp.]
MVSELVLLATNDQRLNWGDVSGWITAAIAAAALVAASVAARAAVHAARAATEQMHLARQQLDLIHTEQREAQARAVSVRLEGDIETEGGGWISGHVVVTNAHPASLRDASFTVTHEDSKKTLPTEHHRVIGPGEHRYLLDLRTMDTPDDLNRIRTVFDFTHARGALWRLEDGLLSHLRNTTDQARSIDNGVAEVQRAPGAPSAQYGSDLLLPPRHARNVTPPPPRAPAHQPGLSRKGPAPRAHAKSARRTRPR